MNGFTLVDGEMFLWVSIREENKMHQDFPGKFDHLVAGGQVRLYLYEFLIATFTSNSVMSLKFW